MLNRLSGLKVYLCEIISTQVILRFHSILDPFLNDYNKNKKGILKRPGLFILIISLHGDSINSVYCQQTCFQKSDIFKICNHD